MLTTSLPDLEKFVISVEYQADRASRRAISLSLCSIYEEAWRISKTRYHRLPKSSNKGKLTSFKNMMQRAVKHNAGVIKASTKPYSVIHTVIGSRQPRAQAGIPIRKRRGIYVKIAGNRKRLGRGQYIAAPRKQRMHNVTQVFFKNKYGKIFKQSYSSIYQVLLFPENQERLARVAEESFTKAYDKLFSGASGS